MTQAEALTWALDKIAPKAQTLTNWCGYNSAGIRIAVVYPYQGQFANGRSYGGYPVLFPTLAAAQADCELRQFHPIVRWEQVEIPQ